MYLRGGARERLQSGRRRGMAVAWLVMTLPLLALAFSLAVNLSSDAHRQAELQVSIDASALAGANAEAPHVLRDTSNNLVSDMLLTSRTDRQAQMIANAYNAIAAYGQLNFVGGNPLILDVNPTNDPAGEIVLATLDSPTAPLQFPNLMQPYPDSNLYNPFLNAVRTAAVRNNVFASATAYLDRDVYGFRVSGSSDTLPNSNQPAIPLVPLAIMTDYTHPTPNPGSWEYNIISRLGPDNWGVNANDQPTQGADGIPEIVVTFTGNVGDNGQVVAIPFTGSSTSGALAAQSLGQIATGITASQLAAYDSVNQQLSIFNGTDNQQPLTSLTLAATDLENLGTALSAIAGQRRVWMLFDTSSAGQVNIVGFVAARVLQVTTQQSNNHTTGISVVLQPTMLLTSTALTDRTKRNLGPRTNQYSTEAGQKSLYNPYIARVRIVQ